MSVSSTTEAAAVLTPADLLSHWQGHRRLTRRVIEAFPDDQLFAFSIGGMRPFGALAWELVGVADYNLHGLTTDEWTEPRWNPQPAESKAALLAAWDELTRRLDEGLPGVPAGLYRETRALLWGSMPLWVAVIYAVDNEIHHRGQGYVYLRALGIEPPLFYER